MAAENLFIGKRVLVVDDEPAVRALTKAILHRLGCSVESAASGLESLQWIEARDFDLMITDLHMPGMNGQELAREVRQRNRLIPIILITGGRIEKPLTEFIEVLQKPFSSTILREAVARAFLKGL